MARAAVVGGGVIGGGWAARFLLMGWDVALFDPDPEADRKIGEVLANARAALPGLWDVPLPREGRLTRPATLEAAVAGADWVCEAVPERLVLKHAVYAQIQAAAPGVPIASSTSGFRPSELQQGAAEPGAIFVAHPFNPVYLLPLVELVGSPANAGEVLDLAAEVLTGLGMYPLRIRAEIDAHIADRLLEAVWREALWLVKDGIATTREIDESIRMGFGLRWAQMGLFETYRIAGGEAGMAHFLEQFGPALKWPWTKLMDVPDLDDALVAKIAGQSDAQSGMHSIRDLERIRDRNLVAMMRALKAQDWGAGAVLRRHDRRIAPAVPDLARPFTTLARTVPLDWTDYNGHMNEARYLEAFAAATDVAMEWLGCDAAYIAAGRSYFTAETHIRHVGELLAGAAFRIETQVLEGQGRKLHLYHRMVSQTGEGTGEGEGEGEAEVATGEHMLIHVDLATRRACEPGPAVARPLAEVSAAHAALDRPAGAGRAVGRK